MGVSCNSTIQEPGVKHMIKPFGFDLFCFGKKFLVFNLISRDLKIKYRRSFLGFFWTILHPLILSGVYFLVFKVILRVEIPHYIVFILSGVIPWTFLATAITEGTETLVANSGLLTKVPIPTQVFPLVTSLSNFVTFLLALGVVALFALVSGVSFDITVLVLPLLCTLLLVIAHSFSIVLCVAVVYLRDLRHAVGLILQLWFYLTPVIYQESLIPQKYKPLIYLNPVGTLISCFHDVFTGRPIVATSLLASVVWALTLFSVAVPIHKRFSRRVVECL